MNSPVIGLRVASVIFGLVCIGQLTRLLMQLEVMVAGRHVPMWCSGIAVVATAVLCVWLWKLSVPAKAPAAGGSAPPQQPTAAAP